MSDSGVTKGPRPVSTTSSQLSISDRMTDDEDFSLRSNLLAQASSSCSSSLNALQQAQRQNETRGPSKTTTISTIAMESVTSPPGSGSKSSPTKLVIALLQTPHLGLQLKVIEMNPGLLKLPDNLPDAEDFLKNHSQVIKNLQSKQSPVEELLRQADALISSQKPKAEVYAAMADSLGQTWKDLNGILEDRRFVIQLAFNAHQKISECVQRMDEVHSEYSKINYFGEGEVNPLESLAKLKADRASILKLVAQCLEACDQLLNKIAQYNYTVDSRELVLMQDVEIANRQVHRWLERLHDRRVILEERLKNKRDQLQEASENSKYEKDIQSLLAAFNQYASLLADFNFGDSVLSAETRKEQLRRVVMELKELKETALAIVKRLEDVDFQRGKFTQRYGLKNKIFEILGQINELLTDTMDFDTNLSVAKEFFQLAEMAKEKMDLLSSKGDLISPSAKNDLNNSVFDAISKGKILLVSYGWDSPKVRGVRNVHDSLLKNKDILLEEIEHLEILGKYNLFLEEVNQTYQNILNIETSTVRQKVTVPIQLDAVNQFKAKQEKTLEEVSRKLELDSLMSKLHNIYPDLSEEEKCGTESKINELKSLSNLLVETLVQRIELSTVWIKVLEIYKSSQQEGENKSRAYKIQQIIQMHNQKLKPLLEETHQKDGDLVTNGMENEVERIIKELKDASDSNSTKERIREICHKYKTKLDNHLLGDCDIRQPPQYYPVLDRTKVTQALEDTKVQALGQIINKLVKAKLEDTLTNFFTPLVTSYRQEILDAQIQTPGKGKTQDEIDFERYLDRLKESYVRVTRSIEAYLSNVSEVCQQVETRLKEDINRISNINVETDDEDAIERELGNIETFREQISRKIQENIGPQLDHLFQTIRSEEPPIEGEEEIETLRLMMATLGHDEELDNHRELLTREMMDRMLRSNWDLIGNQLQKLNQQIDQPASYGNNLEQAKINLENFEKFENTVEQLRRQLMGVLRTSGLPEHDEKFQLIKSGIDALDERRKKRKDLILLSLEYFKLIDLSYKHYDSVNSQLDNIREESKDPEIKIEKIEDMLKQIQKIRVDETTQENRLHEIDRISNLIFADSAEMLQNIQHKPLVQKNRDMAGELQKTESDLTELLGFIRSRVLSLADVHLQPRKSEEFVPEKLSAVEECIIPIKQEAFRHSPMPETQPPTTLVEVKETKELQTIKVTSTIRRSLSPVFQQPITVEKETQFETEEELPAPKRVDRDTVTQTVDEKIFSIETQTEMPKVISTTSTSMEEIQTFEKTVSIPAIRPVSKEYQNPMFIQPLKDLVVNEGDHVVLECRATGQVKRLVWLKDGLEVTNNPDYKTEFLDASIARLTIDEVFHEDSAVFTCRAIGGEFDSIVVETSGKLTVREPAGSVMQPPKFLPHPPVSIGTHGKSHLLELKVEGNPLPTVQFYKNGQCIDTSPDYIITFNNGLCQVQFDELLKDLDEGIYSCIARNQMGKAESHVELQIKGDGSKKGAKQKPKIIRKLPKNVMSRAGQPLRLECEFESPTECNILWWKDDSTILNYTNSSAEMRTIGNIATLSFSEVYPVDSGRYSVLIRNAAGETESDCTVQVKGLLPPETSDSELNMSDGEIVTPVVKMHLKSGEYGIGECVKLDSVISGRPEPEVIWYKDSIPIKESPNHHLVFHGDRCSLIIKCATENDQGKYSVVAVNNGGETSSSCQVSIFGDASVSEPAEEEILVNPPKFAQIIQDQMVTAGDKFKFILELAPECSKGTEVVWYKNNKKIEPDTELELSKDGNVYSLQFNECKLSDKGNYMAKATNSAGDAKCFACLIVKENLELQQKAGGDVWEETLTSDQPRIVPVTRIVQKAPRFVVPLEGRMVSEGDENVVLKCVIEANPPAQLRWSKNNSTDLVLPSLNFEQRYNEKTGAIELMFKRISVEDAGRYSLNATNELGISTSVCDMVVKKASFPPVFSKRLQSLTLQDGKRLYLEVDVYSKPPPEIIWELNNQKIIGDNEFILKSDTPTRHSLIIPQVVGPKHTGEYKVTARNEAGEASSTCYVSVTGRASPIPPPVPIKPKLFTSSQIIESKSQTSDFGGQPILQETTTMRQEYSSFQESKTFSSTNFQQPTSPFPNLEAWRELSSPIPGTTLMSEGIGIEPGPKPEILVAPSPTHWKSTKNQVLEKVKTFEERSETPDLVAPPSGGVRLIPIKEQSQPKTLVTEKPQEKVVDLPIYPLQPFPFSVPETTTQLPPSAILLEEPKHYFDSTSSFAKEDKKTDHGYSSMEQRQQSSISSSEVKYIKPSKFIPGKMIESDYESDFEVGFIPSKWVPPPIAEPSPVFSQQPIPTTPTTTSAFAPFKSTSVISSSSSWEKRTETSQVKYSSSGEKQKPAIPPKPQILSPVPPPFASSDAGPDRVRQLIKSWPPKEMQETESHMMTTSTSENKYSTSQLSPRPAYDEMRRAGTLSPTPSKEALEMDKLWSRPIRFSSPTPTKQFGHTPISSPPLVSPRLSDIRSPTPPLVPPKPKFATTRPYTPIISPSPLPKPQFEPHPTFGPKSPKEPLYYVSVVSTPRTTPVPPPMSPTTPTPESMNMFSESMNFQEMKDFFEQTSSSSFKEEMTSSSSYHHSSSSSKNFSKYTKTSDSGFSLLDSSFLPPPGEAPEFLYAPPINPQTKRNTTGDVSMRSSEFSSSSKSMMRQDQQKDSQPKGDKIYEIRVQPPTPPVDTSHVTSSHSLSKALVPYIKPSKFTPILDFASSLDKQDKYDVPMRQKWNPKNKDGTVTTWKRVSYDPQKHSWKEPNRRNSLANLVDQKMQDLNRNFKDNINFMTQGLCYNKMDRKISSQIDPNDATESNNIESVEPNPLIYFKYDFGYEFGIADKSSVIRASSEPPTRGQSYIADESGNIHLPIIHETSKKF